MKRTPITHRIAGCIGIGALVLATLLIVQNQPAAAQQSDTNDHDGVTYAKEAVSYTHLRAHET